MPWQNEFCELSDIPLPYSIWNVSLFSWILKYIYLEPFFFSLAHALSLSLSNVFYLMFANMKIKPSKEIQTSVYSKNAVNWAWWWGFWAHFNLISSSSYLASALLGNLFFNSFRIVIMHRYVVQTPIKCRWIIFILLLRHYETKNISCRLRKSNINIDYYWFAWYQYIKFV